MGLAVRSMGVQDPDHIEMRLLGNRGPNLGDSTRGLPQSAPSACSRIIAAIIGRFLPQVFSTKEFDVVDLDFERGTREANARAITESNKKKEDELLELEKKVNEQMYPTSRAGMDSVRWPGPEGELRTKRNKPSFVATPGNTSMDRLTAVCQERGLGSVPKRLLVSL